MSRTVCNKPHLPAFIGVSLCNEKPPPKLLSGIGSPLTLLSFPRHEAAATLSGLPARLWITPQLSHHRNPTPPVFTAQIRDGSTQIRDIQIRDMTVRGNVMGNRNSGTKCAAKVHSLDEQ